MGNDGGAAWVAVVQNLIYGIQLGSLYALIALGYTMVYGVLRLINFAHGEVYMVGAFVGYFACERWLPLKNIVQHPNAVTHNILWAIVGLMLTMAVCALLGVLIERFAYRPLRNGLKHGDAHFWGFALALPIALRFAPNLLSPQGLGIWLVAGIALGFALRPVMTYLSRRIVLSSSRLNALITAIGVSLLLQNGGLKVFGTTPLYVGDFFPSKTIELPAGLQIQVSNIVILVVSLVLMGILRHIVLYTQRGKAMRAISHDIEAAKLMGINTDGIISFTFALGASLAGAAGFLVAVMTHIKITPTFGVLPGLKAFVAAVLGGAGNIPGAVVGGLTMGVAEYQVTGRLQSYRDAVAFVILILILLVRPAGLFGKSVPEKV
jgi:branched-chain amino acid transport system permease protein